MREFHRHIHSMKGCMLYLMANELADICKVLNTLAHNEVKKINATPSYQIQWSEELHRNYTMLLPAIEAVHSRLLDILKKDKHDCFQVSADMFMQTGTVLSDQVSDFDLTLDTPKLKK